MDEALVSAGVLLILAGLVGVLYGVVINVPGMISRGATNYSSITAYIIEWILVLVAGLTLVFAGAKKN